MHLLKNKIWVDLEPNRCYHGLEEYPSLAEKISVYQQLEKTDKKIAAERIKFLKEIAEESHNLNKDAQNPLLQLISQTSSNKALYLSKLLKLNKKATDRLFRILKMEAGKKGVGRGVGPEYATHQKEFESVMDLDPANREMIDSFIKWEKEVQEKGDSVPDFYFWLEKEKHPLFLEPKRTSKKEETLVFFNDDGQAYIPLNPENPSDKYDLEKKGYFLHDIIEVEGKHYRPIIANQSLYGRAVGSPKTGYLYTIDGYGHLNIQRGDDTRVHHNNLLEGGTVVCAGIIQFQDGFISYIDTISGHYTPNPSDLKNGLNLMLLHYKNEKILSHLHKYSIWIGANNLKQNQPFEGIEKIPDNDFSEIVLTPRDLLKIKSAISPELLDEIQLNLFDYIAKRPRKISLGYFLSEVEQSDDDLDKKITWIKVSSGGSSSSATYYHTGPKNITLHSLLMKYYKKMAVENEKILAARTIQRAWRGWKESKKSAGS